MTGKKKDVDRYRRIQAQTRYEIRQASRKYLEDVVSEDYRTNSKRFWSYVKSKKQEADGVAPLKDKQGFLRTNSQNKAEILGNQFRSVFTEEYTTSIPDKGPTPYPDMPPIRVSEAGYVQLWRRDSRKLETAHKRFPNRSFNSELVYYEVSWNCVHGGRVHKSRSGGDRPNTSTYRQACPFFAEV
ncbi:hypothetical protein ACOMHN_042567 [Nucella lapillus]